MADEAITRMVIVYGLAALKVNSAKKVRVGCAWWFGVLFFILFFFWLVVASLYLPEIYAGQSSVCSSQFAFTYRLQKTEEKGSTVIAIFQDVCIEWYVWLLL